MLQEVSGASGEVFSGGERNIVTLQIYYIEVTRSSLSSFLVVIQV